VPKTQQEAAACYSLLICVCSRCAPQASAPGCPSPHQSQVQLRLPAAVSDGVQAVAPLDTTMRHAISAVWRFADNLQMLVNDCLRE
jgi:hypothetical protein